MLKVSTEGKGWEEDRDSSTFPLCKQRFGLWGTERQQCHVVAVEIIAPETKARRVLLEQLSCEHYSHFAVREPRLRL